MAQRLVRGLLFAAIGGAVAFLILAVRDDRNGPPIIIEDAPADVDVTVWVVGAVATPGVYSLPIGSRLNDAITAAGGLSELADLRSINLATRIEDEERIEIPFVAAAVPSQMQGTPASLGIRAVDAEAVPVGAGQININTADAAELESLPGIGPAIAARIIDFRTEIGPFERIEELAQVDGVSTAMVEELSDLITIGP